MITWQELQNWMNENIKEECQDFPISVYITDIDKYFDLGGAGILLLENATIPSENEPFLVLTTGG